MSVELEVSSSRFIQRREDYFQLMKKLFPDEPKLWCCGAEVISYFQNWNGWKKEHYREEWFYQPIRQIYKDMMCAHSIHKIRAVIKRINEAGVLLVKKNDRALNSRNGQDKVHFYLIDSNRLKSLLAELVPQSKKSRKKSQTGNAETVETASVQVETRCVRADTYTKILSIDPSKKYSLLEREEKLDSVQEEEIEDPWTVDEDELDRELLELFNGRTELLEKQEVSDEGHFSAPAEPELIKTVETKTSPSSEPKCSEVVQTDLKPLPKLKSDRVSGFRSDNERDGFYRVLLELGRTQGKKSPAAWSTKIIKSVDAGEPCHYLSEYREGQQVGSCEQQEWEVSPGQVFPRFISFLTTRLKRAEMTDEQAIVTAHQQLKDVNLARSLWESCKRYIAKCQEDWEKQNRLGVQNAYLPPELLPKPEVSVEQLGSAIASLQAGSVQLQGLPESARAELEPAKEEPSTPEPEPISPVELQEKLNLPLQAPLARMMARNAGYRIEEDLVLPGEGMPCLEYMRSLLTNPINARKVERLIAAHPDWGFWIDERGELQDF